MAGESTNVRVLPGHFRRVENDFLGFLGRQQTGSHQDLVAIRKVALFKTVGACGHLVCERTDFLGTAGLDENPIVDHDVRVAKYEPDFAAGGDAEFLGEN